MMDDRDAFERQLASEVTRMAGPGPAFDALAIARSAMTAPSAARRRIATRLWGGPAFPLDGGIPVPMERGLPMLTALKFIAASVIVALFGGFLMMGVFTTQQSEEMPPAAVTTSPQADPDQPSEPPGPATPDELLAMAGTEQVEPGVYRVVNDGVADVDLAFDDVGGRRIVAGLDGGIWVLDAVDGHYYRLGDAEPWHDGLLRHRSRDWPEPFDAPGAFVVASDGTAWAVFDDELYSLGAGSDVWTRHEERREHIRLASDGTAWALWQDDPGDRDRGITGYYGTGGWQPVGELPYGGWVDLLVSDRGDVWAVGNDDRVHHFVDGAWRTVDEVGLNVWGSPGDFPPYHAAAGGEGILWGNAGRSLARIDDAGWALFERPEWMWPDAHAWRLVEDEWVAWYRDPVGAGATFLDSEPWGEFQVAPDGALWVPLRLGAQDDRPVCGNGFDGVVRFDGETWSRHLQGYCVEAMDFATDGSVWLMATASDARYPVAMVYVITPSLRGLDPKPPDDDIVLSGEGDLRGDASHALTGDYRVTVEAYREDRRSCVINVSLDDGQRPLGHVWHGTAHGIGTSAARGLDGEYVIDVRAPEECGPWKVSVAPLREESE